MRPNLPRQGGLSLRRVEIRPVMPLRVHFQGRDIMLCCPVSAARRSNPRSSNLQLLRKAGEDSTTSLCDDYHIFLARAAHAWIVKTWLDGENLAIFQHNFL